MQTASNVIIAVSIVFMLIGIIGIFKFRTFYPRILITAKIDTIGAITFIIGIAFRHGMSYFTLKLLLIVVIILILNPLANHMVAHGAYLSGYGISNGEIKDEHTGEETA